MRTLDMISGRAFINEIDSRSAGSPVKSPGVETTGTPLPSINPASLNGRPTSLAISGNDEIVCARRVFQPWDYFVFGVLTTLSGIAIGYAAILWISGQAWKQAPWLFGGLTLITIGVVAVQQARWWLLPLMRSPAPLPIRRPWRVAVATTFVPDSEPLDMLEATVKALVLLDYPHDTWVLDEGNDQQVKDLCRKYGVRHFSRKDRSEFQAECGSYRSGTKFGNYNAWLAAVGFSDYDIVTTFDPDHLPEPSFLTTVLGYFADPKVAYVQAAQAYGNQQESWIAQGAAEETYDYFSTIQMACYGMRLPMIVGGHNTHRVAALREIGGFAAHDADDILTTLCYRDAGWQGVYVPKIRARGRTPADWHAYLTQQRRWARSVLDIKLRTYPSLSAKAPLATRLLSFLHGMNYLAQGLLPILLIGILALICATAANTQGVLQQFIVPMGVLTVPIALCEFYRQRFYLDQHRERGIHWRGAILRWTKWPQMLLALWDVILNRHPPYSITAKVQGKVPQGHLLWPHYLSAVALAGCWLLGVASGQATLLSHGIAAGVLAATIALALSARHNANPRSHRSVRDGQSRAGATKAGE